MGWDVKSQIGTLMVRIFQRMIDTERQSVSYAGEIARKITLDCRKGTDQLDGYSCAHRVITTMWHMVVTGKHPATTYISPDFDTDSIRFWIALCTFNNSLWLAGSCQLGTELLTEDEQLVGVDYF